MDTKRIQRFISVLLVLSVALTLTACGHEGPAAEPNTWTDPNPQIRGTIKDGVYQNTWLNLTYKTVCNTEFLEEYNRVSCLADPDLCRWCELHEFNSLGESLLLTAEKIPEGKTFETAASERSAAIHARLNNTDPDIQISAELEETQTDYWFNGNTCTMNRYTITTRHAQTGLEEKNDVMLFWEKDGHLITLRQVSLGDDPFSKINLFLPIEEVEAPASMSETTNILVAPSAWQFDGKSTHYPVNIQYALLPDGTCYGIVNYIPVALGGYSGTYTIEGNILSLFMNFNLGESYEVRYEVDTQAQTITQISNRGPVEGQGAGITYSYQEAYSSPEDIAKQAVNLQESGGFFSDV